MANLPLLLDQNGHPVPMVVDGFHEQAKVQPTTVAPDEAGEIVCCIEYCYSVISKSSS